MSSATSHSAAIEVDFVRYELRVNGLPRRLEKIPMEVLLLVVEREGELVTRDEIIARVWGEGVFVDTDSGINTAVRKIRQALGDDPDAPRFLQTVVGKGYRFIAEVSVVGRERPSSGRPASRLRRIAALSAIVGGLLAVAMPLGWRKWISAPQAKVMLAVLPFDNLSEDPEQQYFSDGLTEEMITQLGEINPERLGVIARTTSMRYKGAHPSVVQIGEELGVAYVVEGSVRREGSRVRVTAQLIRTADESHVWARSYDRELDQLLAIQVEVASSIRNEIAQRVGPTPSHRRKAPVDLRAYEAYLKGRFYSRADSADLRAQATAFYRQAIALDAEYAPAYAGLADHCREEAVASDEADAAEWAQAEEAANRSLQLDDSLAEGHTALAAILLYHRWDWLAAERHLRRALQSNPSDPDTHSVHAIYLRVVGDLEGAIRERLQAHRLDPLRADLLARAALECLFANRVDEQLEHARHAIALAPANGLARYVEIQALISKGMFEQAANKQAELLRLQDRPDAAKRYLQIYDTRGFDAARRELLEESLRLERGRAQPDRWYMANMEALLGKKEEAFRWLEEGLEHHEPGLLQIRVDPDFAALRPEPRYAELVRRIGFPPAPR